MRNFKVKSKINDYFVEFIDDSAVVLNKELKDGDVIIIDRKIADNYEPISKIVSKNNLVVKIDAHENQKSYHGIIPLIDKLVKHGFRKNHRLIGIGGGITQDITAFTSSILFRGVDWIFFPTTLLAQGDSCIGSKTSINYKNYKNQIGGFYPAKHVYIDLNFLKTLNKNDFQSGLGEMCHYFIVSGEEDFKFYKNSYPEMGQNISVLKETISKSLKIKKSYIEIDEFDQNERQVFNYGHTFGHAIETLTDYSIPHGIAVSFGMDIANFISTKMGLLKIPTRLEIRELLAKIWDGFTIKDIDINRYSDALAKDKKSVGNELRLILCKGYGKTFKTPVKNDENLHNWLREYFLNEI